MFKSRPFFDTSSQKVVIGQNKSTDALVGDDQATWMDDENERYSDQELRRKTKVKRYGRPSDYTQARSF